MPTFHLSYTVPPAPVLLQHRDKVLLTGSCFTEHIGSRMMEGKMQVLVNPQGIVFNPMSIAGGLRACLESRSYTREDLFFGNETWNNWDFHSRFSHTSREEALLAMNRSIAAAGAFLKNCRWLVVTFGSAYQYFTTASAGVAGRGVANCHKAPGQWFEKQLLAVDTMQQTWSALIPALQRFNPELRLIFTVSPVRHLRDGLVENNRSKARLIELAHLLAEGFGNCTYFPAYELVIDVLRDYRFFEQDMAHPDPVAAQYVWEQFVEGYMNKEDRELLSRIKEITTAMQHRPRFPGTTAAATFRAGLLKKVMVLQQQFPYLDLEQELRFSGPGADLL